MQGQMAKFEGPTFKTAEGPIEGPSQPEETCRAPDRQRYLKRAKEGAIMPPAESAASSAAYAIAREELYL